MLISSSSSSRTGGKCCSQLFYFKHNNFWYMTWLHYKGMAALRSCAETASISQSQAFTNGLPSVIFVCNREEACCADTRLVSVLLPFITTTKIFSQSMKWAVFTDLIMMVCDPFIFPSWVSSPFWNVCKKK